jgi:hypothetical protein
LHGSSCPPTGNQIAFDGQTLWPPAPKSKPFGDENNLIFLLRYPSGFGILQEMKINEQVRGYFAEIGRRGGKSTSEAKAQAARENAKKGGWPKGKPRKAKQ